MTKPAQNVTVQFDHVANQLTATSLSDGTKSVTFTPANWNVPQRVRVTAVDDTLQEGVHHAYISHSITTTDNDYQQAFVLEERVLIRDNDVTDVTGPRITNVIVGSSDWSASFIDAIDGGGVGAGNRLGFSLIGAGQLNNLPWTNLNRIYIQFSESVETPSLRPT